MEVKVMEFRDWYHETRKQAAKASKYPAQISAHIFNNYLKKENSAIETQTKASIKENVERATKEFEEKSTDQKFVYANATETWEFLETATELINSSMKDEVSTTGEEVFRENYRGSEIIITNVGNQYHAYIDGKLAYTDSSEGGAYNRAKRGVDQILNEDYKSV